MHLFISYAKKDTHALAEELHDTLNTLPGVSAWMDQSLETAESWATQIQVEIDKADYVIVLLSPDINRPATGTQRRSFVLNEVDYAQQEGKRVIPIMAKPTKIPVQLAGIQYIDLTASQALGLRRVVEDICTIAGIENTLPEITSTFETPIVRRSGGGRWIGGAVLLIIGAAVGVILGGRLFAATVATPIATVTVESTAVTPATQAVAIVASSTDATAAVVQPSLTATPNLSATAMFIQTFVPAATNSAAATQTAMVIPTATNKPLPTQTPTVIASATDKPAPTEATVSVPVVNATVVANADWTPVIQNFNGTDMVMVPAGCFNMGSTSDQMAAAVLLGAIRDYLADEQPVTKVCFQQPFWIDRTEVTNAQYGSVGFFGGDNNPRDSLNWAEAESYCDARGARLPTESEWEYAARGPDGLIFPWGNDFVPKNAVYEDSSGGTTDVVGSHPDGASWVGAQDMSGNVAERLGTGYYAYPYDAFDGRENLDPSYTTRIHRGGSFSDPVNELRAAYRGADEMDQVYPSWGVRCARDN